MTDIRGTCILSSQRVQVPTVWVCKQVYVPTTLAIHVHTHTQVGLKLDAGSILSRWKTQSQSRLRQIASGWWAALHPHSFVCLDDFTASERSSIPPGLLNYQTNLNPPVAAAWPRSPPYCFPMLGRITGVQRARPALSLVPNAALPQFFLWWDRN